MKRFKSNELDIPIWAVRVVVSKSILSSKYVSLPLAFGLVALLFNIAQGKLIEGLLVGTFAFCVMVFLMQISIVRNLIEEHKLHSFLKSETDSSTTCKWIVWVARYVKKGTGY